MVPWCFTSIVILVGVSASTIHVGILVILLPHGWPLPRRRHLRVWRCHHAVQPAIGCCRDLHRDTNSDYGKPTTAPSRPRKQTTESCGSYLLLRLFALAGHALGIQRQLVQQIRGVCITTGQGEPMRTCPKSKQANESTKPPGRVEF